MGQFFNTSEQEAQSAKVGLEQEQRVKALELIFFTPPDLTITDHAQAGVNQPLGQIITDILRRILALESGGVITPAPIGSGTSLDFPLDSGLL